MTDMTEDQISVRDAAFQAAREFPQTKAAFDEVRASMLERIATSPLGDQAGRERLYLAINVLAQVETVLMTVAAGAALAENADLIEAILAGEDPA
jgi:hypothetical protein